MCNRINGLSTNKLCPIFFLIIKENLNYKITTFLSYFIIVYVCVSELVFFPVLLRRFLMTLFLRDWITHLQSDNNGLRRISVSSLIFFLIQPVTRVPFAFNCVSFSDGVWKGKSCGVSGHGLLLRSGGTEAQSRFEKHSMCCGSIQDMERRRVSFWGEDIWTGWALKLLPWLL